MITFNPIAVNEFVIYVDTISNDVETFGDYFLFKFRSDYSRFDYYVIPTVVKRNTRFIQFRVETLASMGQDDPYNSQIYLFPSGNWSYTLWNTESPTLDPSAGILLDEGQMVLLDGSPKEVLFVDYVSNNEQLKSYVYYSSYGIWNNTQNKWNSYDKEWDQS